MRSPDVVAVCRFGALPSEGKPAIKKLPATRFAWAPVWRWRPFLLPSGLPAADLFLFMLTRWGRNLAKPAWDMPALARHFKAAGARPAVRRMMAQQGLEPGPLLA